jgi:hypothetical protein
LFVPLRWLSVTKISPLGATTTSVGWSKASAPDPLAVLAARVGDPQVPARIDGRAVREYEHPAAPAREQLPLRVVLENRRLGSAGARVREAAMDHVDRTVGRGLDGGDRRPFHTRRQLAPVARRAVRLRQIVARRGPALRGRRRHERDGDGDEKPKRPHHRPLRRDAALKGCATTVFESVFERAGVL